MTLTLLKVPLRIFSNRLRTLKKCILEVSTETTTRDFSFYLDYCKFLIRLIDKLGFNRYSPLAGAPYATR